MGRIEDDRGVETFLSLITKLNTVSKDFNVMMIGNGRREIQLRSTLLRILGEARYIHLNHLSQAELTQQWEKIGVLVSAAPSESYGRTIREAVSFGVPVWGVNSTGFSDLKNTSEFDSLEFLDVNLSANQLWNQFQFLLTSDVKGTPWRQYVEENRKNVELLVNSWIHNVT